MAITNEIKKWDKQRVLIIGEALIDKYIFGHANKISPDAPVPNIKIERSSLYLGGIGLVLQYIKSLGGIPEICTLIGNDFEGEFFLKKIKDLNVDTSGIVIDKTICTPQITRIKAMNQHLLRLETDYSNDISNSTIKEFFEVIASKSKPIGSIIILDYGIGGLFKDVHVQSLLEELKEKFENVPVIARPNLSNYYVYENIDLIKMTLQKALRTLSIDCCNETSIMIAGKRILNSSKCRNLFLNDIMSESFLCIKDSEKIEKFSPLIEGPVRSFIAVGSVIMSILGLSLASKIPTIVAAKIALYGASLSAILPPVEFFDSEKLCNYILENDINKQ